MEAGSSSSDGGIRPFVLVLLLLSSFLFLFLFLPSMTGSGFRPTNGWNALNLSLVLFAILCGILGRNNNNNNDDDLNKPQATTTPTANDLGPPLSTGVDNRTVRIRHRMTKSCSSYADLSSQEEAWWGPTHAWRFSDDIDLYRNNTIRWDDSRIAAAGGSPHPDSLVETVPVDTFQVKPPSPTTRSRLPTPPPPPPPPPLPRHPRKMMAKKPPPEKPDPIPEPTLQLEEPESKPPPPPPPPPPPMSPMRVEFKRVHRKKSGNTKDLAAALALFYQKKKKSKIKKIYHDETTIAESTEPVLPPTTPPLPPPLPSSMFHQLFSKKSGSKGKRHHHSYLPPPPPPPPRPKQNQEHIVSTLPQNLIHKRRYKPRSATNSYPLPPSPLGPSTPSNPPEIYYSIPLPPPPPPPPLIDSDKDIDGKEQETQEFCSSPDVNNKAEMFITRFRAGLELEKLNSIKNREQQGGENKGLA